MPTATPPQGDAAAVRVAGSLRRRPASGGRRRCGSNWPASIPKSFGWPAVCTRSTACRGCRLKWLAPHRRGRARKRPRCMATGRSERQPWPTRHRGFRASLANTNCWPRLAAAGWAWCTKPGKPTWAGSVAVKMILASRLASPHDVRRFQREARAAGSLRHPHIVGIHEVGECHGQHYFTMDFIAGEDLAHRLARGPIDADAAAGLLLGVARAVEYLHAAGMIHRDLKPSNILIDESGSIRLSPISGWPNFSVRGRADRDRHDHGNAQLHVAGTGGRAGRPRSVR